MTGTQPFGNLQTATILVIGHDPRLQKSQAEAEKPFFFEYLKKYPKRPNYGPDARKYDLAHAVWDYINDLAGQRFDLDQFFVTNLCNEYLPSTNGKGTVLIPDQMAEEGTKGIGRIISEGNFSLILPMSVQVFYHLCRLHFVDENDGTVRSFTKSARPSFVGIAQGVYRTLGKAPFVEVCGKLFHHRGIPLVPVVHIKQWPLKLHFIKYTEPMESAKREVRKVLSRTIG